jgi:hypothetical protein
MCLRPNADAPTSLSSVLLLGLHGIGESPDEGRPPPGGLVCRGKDTADPASLRPICTACKKGNGPVRLLGTPGRLLRRSRSRKVPRCVDTSFALKAAFENRSARDASPRAGATMTGRRFGSAAPTRRA